jgi:zinc protease
LLSNTLDEGAADLTSEKFQGILRDQAIDLGYDSGRDSFTGNMRTLTSHKDTAIRLLKTSINQPRFDAEPIERMKQANLVRIRSSMNDGGWIGARILNDRIYAGHVYARNTGGTITGMEAMTSADLKAARARLFARDRLIIGMTGDITKEEAARIADDIFGNLPDTTKTPGISRFGMPAAGKPAYYAKDMPQTDLSMAWPGIDTQDPDYYATVVMNYIFGGGGFSSRLMTQVREERGLTYGIYSSQFNLDYADRFIVQGSMLPQNVVPTITLVKEIADSMKTTDVTPESLQTAKDYLIGSLPLSLSSTMNIADTLVGLQLNKRAITALDDYRAKIAAVTPADLRRVAARIFSVDPIIVTVGAKPDNLDVETVTVIPDTEGKKP